MTRKFKIGDNVQIETNKFSNVPKGIHGIIIFIDSVCTEYKDIYAIDINLEDIDKCCLLHDCQKRLPQNSGWWFTQKEIKLIESSIGWLNRL